MLRIVVATCLVIAVFTAGAMAQTPAPPQTTASAPSPNQGAFDKLSPGNQKIAKALFDAQQSSSNSTTTKPLSRDDIAAMKQNGKGKGWGQVFKDMQAKGLVQEKNLGQVVRQESSKAGLKDRKDIAEDRRDIKAGQRSNKGGKVRGLDRADEVAGEHGEQGRATAREHISSSQSETRNGTMITTGSGRTVVEGAKVKPEQAGAGENGNGQRPQFSGDYGNSTSGASVGRSGIGGAGSHGKN